MTTEKAKRLLIEWAAQEPAAGRDGKMSTHQWNFGWAKITGKPCPAPEAMGLGNGMKRITMAEYLEKRGL